MASTEDKVLPLPDHIVSKSAGFSLDIGGSIAKVFYRSKEDYEGGKPKDKKKESGVHMVNFQRDDIDNVIALLKEKCDITKNEKGEANIYTTGFGGSLYKNKIEQALGVKINNEPEFPLFVLAFRRMSQNLPEDKIFLPLDEEVLKISDVMSEMLGQMKDFDMLGKENLKTPESYTLPENKDEYFPCLLVLSGSGTPFVVAYKDGSHKILDFPVLGGRFLMGFCKMCCGVDSYAEMDELIEKSEQGQSCDAFPPDLVPSSPPDRKPAKPDDVDAYNALNRTPYQDLIAKKFRIFPFGKATMPGFEGATKGDILYSMQRSVAEVIAQTAFYASYVMKEEISDSSGMADIWELLEVLFLAQNNSNYRAVSFLST